MRGGARNARRSLPDAAGSLPAAIRVANDKGRTLAGPAPFEIRDGYLAAWCSEMPARMITPE